MGDPSVHFMDAPMDRSRTLESGAQRTQSMVHSSAFSQQPGDFGNNIHFRFQQKKEIT